MILAKPGTVTASVGTSHVQGYEKTTRRGGGSALRNTAGQCSRAGGDPRVGRHPDAHPE